MKRRYWVLIGLGAFFGLIFIVYGYGPHFATVELTVRSHEGKSYGSPPAITLNNSLVAQNPKLREVLANAHNSNWTIDDHRIYKVNMTMAEFDAMNRVFISTQEGKELAKNNPYRSPTVILWPKQVWIVNVNYDGWAYGISCEYHGIRAGWLYQG